MAKNWRDVRAQASLDESRVADHKDTLLRQVRAHRLAELRQRQGLTQTELAKVLHVQQPAISKLERGDISTSSLNTLREYVRALGGELELVANFGDERVVVG